MIEKTIKILFLIVLAVVAIPVGFLYAVLESVYHVLKAALRNIWEAIYALFRGLSKVVSVIAAKFLSGLLIKSSGVHFGTHSVSAVLGANQREKTLANLGVWLANLLDSIDKNHCKKASERAGI
jgi:hypothetical protein